VREGTPVAVLAAVVVAIGAGPYLARLTRTVPDRDARAWWRGRAVTCGEAATATTIGIVLCALAAAATGWSAALPAFVALGLVATPLVVVDVEHRRLPDRLVAAGAALGLVLLGLAAAAAGSGALVRAAVAAGLTFLAFFLVAIAVPASFGFGDVKLAALLGGYLGWLGWAELGYGLLAGFALGAVGSLVLVAAGRASWRSSVPLGPALVGGAFTVAAGSGLF
jgi:leader peptidase (prepilin peptidase) / N-methyltransferase